MPRCCTCDYDPLAPTAYSTSVLSGSKAGQVRYRKKLKDWYCPGCYSSVMATVIATEQFDIINDDIFEDLTDIDYTIREYAPTLPLREFE